MGLFFFSKSPFHCLRVGWVFSNGHLLGISRGLPRASEAMAIFVDMQHGKASLLLQHFNPKHGLSLFSFSDWLHW